MDFMTRNGLYLTVVVLCDSFNQAKESYQEWLQFLKTNSPERLDDYGEAGLFVKMDRFFRYIFCDERMEPTFEMVADTVIDRDTFFALEYAEF